MKKFFIAFIIFAILIGAGIWFIGKSNKNENSNPEISKENTSQNAQTNETENTEETKTPEETQNSENEKSNQETGETQKTRIETELTSFSTKIYNKDAERQNNITITCNSLNNKEIQPGETFSFCDTVGKSTSAKGYQEADIYVDGKKEQGLGGGNCQVSTTLYNAVLKLPQLEVVERHEHSGHVPYIEEGKDAAVAYGAYDFKFKNTTSNTLKIVMENSADAITAKLIEVK